MMGRQRRLELSVESLVSCGGQRGEKGVSHLFLSWYSRSFVEMRRHGSNRCRSRCGSHSARKLTTEIKRAEMTRIMQLLERIVLSLASPKHYRERTFEGHPEPSVADVDQIHGRADLEMLSDICMWLH